MANSEDMSKSFNSLSRVTEDPEVSYPMGEPADVSRGIRNNSTSEDGIDEDEFLMFGGPGALHSVEERSGYDASEKAPGLNSSRRLVVRKTFLELESEDDDEDEDVPIEMSRYAKCVSDSQVRYSAPLSAQMLARGSMHLDQDTIDATLSDSRWGDPIQQLRDLEAVQWSSASGDRRSASAITKTLSNSSEWAQVGKSISNGTEKAAPFNPEAMDDFSRDCSAQSFMTDYSYMHPAPPERGLGPSWQQPRGPERPPLVSPLMCAYIPPPAGDGSSSTSASLGGGYSATSLAPAYMVPGVVGAHMCTGPILPRDEDDQFIDSLWSKGRYLAPSPWPGNFGLSTSAPSALDLWQAGWKAATAANAETASLSNGNGASQISSALKKLLEEDDGGKSLETSKLDAKGSDDEAARGGLDEEMRQRTPPPPLTPGLVSPVSASPVPVSPSPKSSVPKSPAPALLLPAPPFPAAKREEGKGERRLKEETRLRVPQLPVSPAPKSPVSKSPVSKSPMPKSPVSKSSVSKSPASTPSVSILPRPKSPVSKSAVSKSPLPKSPVPVTAVPAAQREEGKAERCAKEASAAEEEAGLPEKSDQVGSEGGDVPRTTVMLRNLPEGFSRDMVTDMLTSEGFGTQVDFVYVPMNFRNKASFGYTFVNLVSPEAADACRERFEGYKLWPIPSDKVCEVSWSGMHQGLEAHIERYRNSPVMHESVPDEFKPAIFDGGVRGVFPPPTKALRPPRVRRPCGMMREEFPFGGEP
eukprot:TRINITY_DN1643_c0_g1_i1.p1 TRINITY_DN1643_c0_g1~~TRINITY_DN1643_c0_g1_i1.p1  ORF type:complete len:790 (-),score=157.77 TRINITY_DN1643_c0_g1_i1:270-2531(-)